MWIVAPIPKIPAIKAKFSEKKRKKNAQRSDTLYEQKFGNLRPIPSITFPKGLKKSKKFGYWSSGSGGKKTLNGVTK